MAVCLPGTVTWFPTTARSSRSSCRDLIVAAPASSVKVAGFVLKFDMYSRRRLPDCANRASICHFESARTRTGRLTLASVNKRSSKRA